MQTNAAPTASCRSVRRSKTFLKSIGFGLPELKRPGSRYEIPNPARRPTAEESAKAASDKEAKQAAARSDMQRRRDLAWCEAVMLIVRASDRSDTRFVSPHDLELARGRVGPEVCEYLRALSYAGIAVRRIGGTELDSAVRLAAYRADLVQRAASDAEGWDRGNLALIERQKGSRRTGCKVEPDLSIPPDVQNCIAKMLADKLARLAKRGGTGGAKDGGGAAAPPLPPPAPAAPPMKAEEEPEDPENGPVPAMLK